MTTTNDDQPTTDAPGGRAPDPHGARVRSTTEAIELVARLVGTAHRRQWWLLMLDDEGRVAPVLPRVEMPRRFGEGEAERLAGLLAHLLDAGPPRLVVVWERPDVEDAAALIGPSLLHAALARRRRELLTQVVVQPGARVSAWEPGTTTVGGPAASAR